MLDLTDSAALNYTEENQNFTVDLIYRILKVKPNANIGLFTFGERTYPEFYMNSNSSLEMMSAAVRSPWNIPGKENLVTAMLFTMVTGYQRFTGNRACVPNYLVVVTYNPIASDDMAAMLRKVLDFKAVQAVVVNLADCFANTNENISKANNENYDMVRLSTNVSYINDTLLLNDTFDAFFSNQSEGPDLAEKYFISLVTDASYVVTVSDPLKLGDFVESVASIVFSGNYKQQNNLDLNL